MVKMQESGFWPEVVLCLLQNTGGILKELSGRTEFRSMCTGTMLIAVFIAAVSLVIAAVFPAPTLVPTIPDTAELASPVSTMETEISFDDDFAPLEQKFAVNDEDMGLQLYRNPVSRGAVEWFYMHVTGNRDVTLAILQSADSNDIPLSLAFALAHTESGFNPEAFNKNTNNSIDRGLFQLNNGSFPKLSRDDFYDPSINAKYGLSHLRFCLDTAGNEITALAMYNAGTYKVKKNNTPQVTLNYVSKIVSYRDSLDELFNLEVVSFYNDGASGSRTAVLAKK